MHRYALEENVQVNGCGALMALSRDAGTRPGQSSALFQVVHTQCRHTKILLKDHLYFVISSVYGTNLAWKYFFFFHQ